MEICGYCGQEGKHNHWDEIMAETNQEIDMILDSYINR